jgi:hypothetical protein
MRANNELLILINAAWGELEQDSFFKNSLWNLLLLSDEVEIASESSEMNALRALVDRGAHK